MQTILTRIANPRKLYRTELRCRLQGRGLLLLAGLVVGLFCALLFARPAAAQGGGLSASGQAVVDAINRQRAEHGLGQVQVNAQLNQAAQGHVDDMLTNHIYGHYGSDGSSVHQRVARTGYSETPWVSENWVSAGSPESAMRWWMNDYIHRVNILTPRWMEIGVGVGSRGNEMIFVTVFSAGRDADGRAVEAEPSTQAEPPSVRIEPQSVPPEGLDYTVQHGDTLMDIGLRYGTTWEKIAEANGLDERSLLQIGQVVRIPGSGQTAAQSPAAAQESGQEAVATEAYTVQPGDTLFSIAAQRGVTWQEVAAVNSFNEQTVLQIDQEIQVPVSPEGSPEPVAVQSNLTETGASIAMTPDPGVEESPHAIYHTVREGETVFSIAVDYNLNWQEMLQLNDLTEQSVLQVGQQLRLRSGS